MLRDKPKANFENSGNNQEQKLNKTVLHVKIEIIRILLFPLGMVVGKTFASHVSK